MVWVLTGDEVVSGQGAKVIGRDLFDRDPDQAFYPFDFNFQDNSFSSAPYASVCGLDLRVPDFVNDTSWYLNLKILANVSSGVPSGLETLRLVTPWSTSSPKIVTESSGSIGVYGFSAQFDTDRSETFIRIDIEAQAGAGPQVNVWGEWLCFNAWFDKTGGL